MNYDLSIKEELLSARNRITYLAKKNKKVSIKQINDRRSINQNSYLHLLLGYFGSHFGYTLEESKMIYKRVSSDIYFYTKRGIKFIRSSADLNKEDMAKTIDRFMSISSEAGLDLPPATNKEWLMRIENEIEKNRMYL
jgi:hypothetical protein